MTTARRATVALLVGIGSGLAGCGDSGLRPGATDGSADGPGFTTPLDGSNGMAPEVTGVSGDAACATSSVKAERLPLDLYMMIDSSYSMLEDTAAGPSKWDAVRAAIAAFMADPQSAGLGLGIQYFPLVRPDVPEDCAMDAACGAHGPCLIAKSCSIGTKVQLCDTDADCVGSGTCVPLGGCATSPDYCTAIGGLCAGGDACQAIAGYCLDRDICDATMYATPAVPIATLPGAAGAIMASLTAKKPEGRTPTGPALDGAIKLAQAQIKANPTHRVAVVLATDGFPVACMPDNVPGVALIAEAAERGNPSIPTFAVGVVAPDEQQASLHNLGIIATSGGTARPFVINTGQNVTMEFQRALASIRTRALTCEYTLPMPSAGKLDYTRVNVTYTTGAGAISTVGNVANKAACDDARGGWYYDVDPATGQPSTIVTCPATCDQLRADDLGRVDVVFGCRTVIIE